MEVIQFILHSISRFIMLLDSVETIIGISWYNLFFTLLVTGIMFNFLIALIRGEQIERETGDKIEKANSYEAYKTRMDRNIAYRNRYFKERNNKK